MLPGQFGAVLFFVIAIVLIWPFYALLGEAGIWLGFLFWITLYFSYKYFRNNYVKYDGKWVKLDEVNKTPMKNRKFYFALAKRYVTRDEALKWRKKHNNYWGAYVKCSECGYEWKVRKKTGLPASCVKCRSGSVETNEPYRTTIEFNGKMETTTVRRPSRPALEMFGK